MNDPSPESPYHAESTGAAAGAGDRIAFVSRSEPANPDGPLTDADGAPLPTLADGGVRLLLFFVVCLQALSWWILEGYQLADSIEYMERAQGFVRGHAIVDSKMIRSFGFPATLTPLFAIADWIGVENFQPVVSTVRLLQMLYGLLLVRICVRLGARFGGRTTGLVAGYFVAVNPVFLQYTVSPVADILAAVLVGHGLEQLLDRGGFRRGFKGGLYFGFAMIIAFKTIIISGPVIVVILLRDRLRHKPLLKGISLGILICLLLQGALDKLIYDIWWVSLWHYILGNVGSNLALGAYHLGFHDLAADLYEQSFYGVEAAKVEILDDPTLIDQARQQGKAWFILHIDEMFVWPILAFLLLGFGLCLRRMSWKSTMLAFTFLANLGLMATKGSKDYRLWIPLIPTVVPLGAWSWRVLTGIPRKRAVLRPILTFGMLAAGLFMGTETLLDRNTRKFMGYWEAIDIVGEEVATTRSEEDPKTVVASAYHWAVFLRESEDLELLKLPWHLDHWATYTDEQKQDDLDAIAELDWFITHLPVLSNHLDLMEAVNRDFEVHAVLWDYELFENIGAVLVMRKHGGDPDAKRLYQVLENVDPEAYRREHHLSDPMHFMRSFGPDFTERVTLLGYEYERIKGDDHGWITYHWYCGSEMRADYIVVDRLTTENEHYVWQNNHSPAYRARPTSTWKPGMVVRESWPVIAAVDPFDWQAEFRPIGGAYRRGDLMPARLWIDLATFGAGGQVTGRMLPTRPDEDQPIRTGSDADVRRTRDGYRFSKDDYVMVGSFFLPVHPSARVPDDGRPISAD